MARSLRSLVESCTQGDTRSEIFLHRVDRVEPCIPLHKAAEEGNVGVVQAWVKFKRSAIDVRDKGYRDKGYTAFHYAAQYNHLEVLRILVRGGADHKLCVAENGYTALHLAAFYKQSNNKETLDFLVKLHPSLDINMKAAGKNFYPLQIAISSGNQVTVAFLLAQENIKTDLRDADNDSILHEVCATNNVEVLELLLEKLKERGQLSRMLTAKNKTDHTPLHRAFDYGQLDMASKLLEFGKDEYELIDPQLFYSRGKQSDITKFIALNGVRILSRRSDGATILHLVSERGWTDAAREIISKDSSLVKMKDDYDQTTLHYAIAAKSSLQIIELLVQNGAEVDALDKYMRTPLLLAASQGNCDAFTKLLREKADLTITDTEGKNAVLLAAEANHNAIILEATQKGQSVFGHVDINKNTALHAAAIHGSVDTLKTLRQCIDVNAPNKMQNTPLHLAAENGHNDFVKMLLDIDENSSLRLTADISAENFMFETALHLAAKKGHYSVAVTLLNKGANVKARDKLLQTPLHYAAQWGHLQVVELLISEHQAEVDCKDRYQQTSLQLAAEGGHLNVVETLFHYKADLKVLNECRLNALDIAIENGHSDVAMAIVKHDQWREVMRNTSRGQPQTTPMRKLIRKMPEVALEVLNNCTTYTKDPKACITTEVTFDCEFLEDFSKPCGKKPADRSTETGIENSDACSPDLYQYLRPSYHFNRLAIVQRIKSKKEHYTEWGPAGFDKANHPLNIMVESNRSELLDHPLVSSLIEYKWKKAWRFYLINILFYVVFVSFLTAYALLLPNPQSELCRFVSFGNASECFNSSNATRYQCGKCSSQTFLYAAGVIIVFCVVIRVFMELFQFLEQPGHYILSYENWLELFLYSFTLIFMSALSRTYVCPEPWQWQIGALAVFLAWIHLSIFIRKVPQLGLYIIMFEHIVQTFVKIAIPALLLVLAFSMAFYMMFFVPSPLFTASPFASSGLSIIKAMTMTVGEMDFETIFRLTSGGVRDITNVPTPLPYFGVSILLWVVFLILMPTLLMNLLTGLAVGDVEKIQSNAEYRKLKLQIELMLKMEEAFSIFHTWCVPEEKKLLFKTNKHSRRKTVRSLLAGVDMKFTREKISKSLSEPIKHIEIEHVYKQTTTLMNKIDEQGTEQKAEMANLRTEQTTEMANLRKELKIIHKKMEKVLELWARREGIDTAGLDEEERDEETLQP